MSEQENKSAKIRRFVSSKLDWLHKMPENAYRAQLANLRRGAGKKPGDLPELWAQYSKICRKNFRVKTAKLPVRNERYTSRLQPLRCTSREAHRASG